MMSVRVKQVLFVSLILNFMTLQNVWGAQTSNHKEERDKLGRDLSRPSRKILGGVTVEENELSYQLHLNLDDGGFTCGATLIDPSFALTATHCLVGFEPEHILVTAGEHKVSEKGENEQQRNVTEIINHEKFKHNNKTGTIHNDISLLRLSAPFEITKYVEPIKLMPPQYPPKDGVRVEASGWGVTTANSSTSSDTLQKVELRVVNNTKCANIYKRYKVEITENHICADNSGIGGKDACQGDSGGPLTAIVGFAVRPYLVGIVSTGNGCGLPGFPGIFTNIIPYTSWINKKMKH